MREIKNITISVIKTVLVYFISMNIFNYEIETVYFFILMQLFLIEEQIKCLIITVIIKR